MLTRTSLNDMIKQRLQLVLQDTETVSKSLNGLYTNWFQNLIKAAKVRKLTEQMEQQVTQGEQGAA